jgi:hypothetical protein
VKDVDEGEVDLIKKSIGWQQTPLIDWIEAI